MNEDVMIINEINPCTEIPLGSPSAVVYSPLPDNDAAEQQSIEEAHLPPLDIDRLDVEDVPSFDSFFDRPGAYRDRPDPDSYLYLRNIQSVPVTQHFPDMPDGWPITILAPADRIGRSEIANIPSQEVGSGMRISDSVEVRRPMTIGEMADNGYFGEPMLQTSNSQFDRDLITRMGETATGVSSELSSQFIRELMGRLNEPMSQGALSTKHTGGSARQPTMTKHPTCEPLRSRAKKRAIRVVEEFEVPDDL